MKKTSKEILKEFVNSQHFTSTTDIMNSMKELFSDVLQTVSLMLYGAATLHTFGQSLDSFILQAYRPYFRKLRRLKQRKVFYSLLFS